MKSKQAPVQLKTLPQGSKFEVFGLDYYANMVVGTPNKWGIGISGETVVKVEGKPKHVKLGPDASFSPEALVYPK